MRVDDREKSMEFVEVQCFSAPGFEETIQLDLSRKKASPASA